MAMNRASDVARYMIECAEEDGQPLSNLKLQKTLYFLWKRYFKENNDYLFMDQYFSAWKFGPVIPSVYYDYFMFGAYPIARGLLESFEEDSICDEDKKFIRKNLADFKEKSVSELTDETHKAGGAWERTFRYKGMKEIIPFTEIEDDVKNGR